MPSNWKSDPFTAEIRDGRIYGRGAIDDKGPAVAVLYALRAIRESGIPLRKNVRFLLGCNEENGSTDLEYYMARHAMPPQVFTPDGSYPIIHLEKGMLRLQFTKATADPIARFSAGHCAKRRSGRCRCEPFWRRSAAQQNRAVKLPAKETNSPTRALRPRIHAGKRRQRHHRTADLSGQ